MFRGFQLSEIKKESKNEYLQNKKSKTNITIRKMFQKKIIQCYKLAITTTKVYKFKLIYQNCVF